jgi:hypothetical protein
VIWQRCNGEQHIRSLSGTLHRVVESQEQIATLGYVDTLEEQALLEEMLEATKPPCPEAAEAYHYLLKTPFRYPPLKWGSRFGATYEPSIFFGAGKPNTALAETAYYRLLFWYSMAAEPIKNTIRSEHTLFSVRYHSERGIRLQDAPFDAFSKELTHPQNYGDSQRLGRDMRAAGVEMFEYSSARDPLHGFCLGLYSPAAFKQKEPQNMTQWLCEVSANEVMFKQVGQTELVRFERSEFEYHGHLPMPA